MSGDQEEILEREEEQQASSGNLIGTKTSQLDDILLDKLEAAFDEETFEVQHHAVAKIASEHSAIDLAFAVSRLPAEARYTVFDNLPDLEAKASFIINVDSYTRAAVLRLVDDSTVKRLLERMPADEGVWVLEALADRRVRRVLEQLNPETANRIRALQKHSRNTAGRLMTNELFAFTMDVTIGQVAATIRSNPGIELTRRIFVLNEAGELQGFVPSRNLIVNRYDIPLRKVMQPILHSVGPDATREEVIDIVERYKIPALPVIDSSGFLVGVITYEDVVEAMEDAADETIARFAGTGEDVSEHEPILRRFILRVPWLLVTACAGLTAATGLSYCSDQPWALAILFFVPLITGVSGNVGIQCSTVLIRSMAIGEISPGTRGDAVAQELTLGAAVGLCFGVACGLIVFSLESLEILGTLADPIVVGSTVCAGVIGACLTSTSLAVSFPFIFARMGIDPAVAAGPIVTALNDVLSTFIFLLVAQGVHALFLI